MTTSNTAIEFGIVDESSSVLTCRGDDARIWQMNKPATPDEVLEQLRGMSFEEREYVRSEMMREDFESGRREDPPEVRAEIIRRAKHAIEHPGEGYSLEQTIATARAVVAAARERKSKAS